MVLPRRMDTLLSMRIAYADLCDEIRHISVTVAPIVFA